jgi:hypothetical protein
MGVALVTFVAALGAAASLAFASQAAFFGTPAIVVETSTRPVVPSSRGGGAGTGMARVCSPALPTA